MLSGVDQIVEPGAMRSQVTILDSYRLREVSIQSTVEGSAHARLNRTLNTRTIMSAARLNLQLGEEVELYKDEGSKDT